MSEYPRSPFKKTGTSITPNISGDGINATPIGETTPAAGSFTTLDAIDSFTKIKRICASNLQSNPTNPPVVVSVGITPGLRFTVGTDKSRALYQIPENYAGGDGAIFLNWTKGASGADESTKEVKWQIKYLGIGSGNNCNSGETTLSVQDTYDDSSLTTQVIYSTDTVTIPAASLTANNGLAIEIEAIAPSGTALADEPVLLGIVCQTTCNKIV